jgi:myo-inositol 2-dehydrogenase/D-chiro-inositol 1-dehydrogenase
MSEPSMQTIRCGLIGYGAWGEHHARAINAAEGAELTAICARSSQSLAKAAADDPHAHAYQDYRQLLRDEQLDLCVVVLPSDLHFEIGKAVLQSGRHLLLEKPMGLNLDQCSELIALARNNHRLLAIGHELRLSSLWGKIKQLIDAGAIGRPLHVLIELFRRPYRLGSGGWRYDIDRVGNWILEEPIHFFDLARWYFSADPTSIYAAANGKSADHPELHDNFSAIVNFDAGRYAVINQTLAGWEHHQTVKITGTAGAIWASWSGAIDRTLHPTFWLKIQRGEKLEEIELPKPAGEVYELVDQFAAVIRAIREGGKVPCTGEDGRWSTAMCLKALQSLRSGSVESF